MTAALHTHPAMGQAHSSYTTLHKCYTSTEAPASQAALHYNPHNPLCSTAAPAGGTGAQGILTVGSEGIHTHTGKYICP